MLSFILIDETWLTLDFTDATIGLIGLKLRSGGVLLAVHKKFESMQIMVPINTVEHIFVLVSQIRLCLVIATFVRQVPIPNKIMEDSDIIKNCFNSLLEESQ